MRTNAMVSIHGRREETKPNSMGEERGGNVSKVRVRAIRWWKPQITPQIAGSSR